MIQNRPHGSVFKILLFSDSDDTNNQLVLDYPERRPVYTYPDHVSWSFGRTSLYFLHILTMKWICCIFLKCDRNTVRILTLQKSELIVGSMYRESGCVAGGVDRGRQGL